MLFAERNNLLSEGIDRTLFAFGYFSFSTGADNVHITLKVLGLLKFCLTSYAF
jgi:hypothetical protein